MTKKKTHTWDELDLSTRARQSVRNMPEYPLPVDMLAALKADYARTLDQMLRVPNCGRQTVNEIFEEIGFNPPKTEKSVLRAKFANDGELLAYIKAHEEAGGVDPEKLDRSSLVLLAQLITKNHVVGRLGKITISVDGDEMLDALHEDEIVELTIRGTRANIRNLIEHLTDGYDHLDKFEAETLLELSNSKKATVVLDG